MFVNKENFVSGADVHTASRSSAGYSCDVHNLKKIKIKSNQNNKRHVYSITMSDSYSTTEVHRAATLLHSNLLFLFFFLTVTCYSLIFCSYFVLIKNVS